MDPIAEIKEISEKLKNSYNWTDTNFEDYLQNLDETGQFEGGKEKRHIRQKFKKMPNLGKSDLGNFENFRKGRLCVILLLKLQLLVIVYLFRCNLWHKISQMLGFLFLQYCTFANGLHSLLMLLQ